MDHFPDTIDLLIAHWNSSNFLPFSFGIPKVPLVVIWCLAMLLDHFLKLEAAQHDPISESIFDSLQLGEKFFGFFEQMTKSMGISLHNYGKDQILLTLSDSFEIFRNREKSFELGEIFHSDLLNGRPELKLLLSVDKINLNLGQIFIQSLEERFNLENKQKKNDL